MKLGVIGSRSFSDKEKLFRELETYVNRASLLVSGGAEGADSLAECWAVENNVPLELFLPDFDAFGGGAYRIRNEKIVENVNLIVAFWDGKSPGTKMTLDYAKKKGVEIKIINV